MSVEQSENQADSTKLVQAANRPTPPNAGKGRVKGVPNKVTKELKEMILGALDKAGGLDYLSRQAEENPASFMTLVGKVLPLTVAGDKDNPIQTVVKFTLAPLE